MTLIASTHDILLINQWGWNIATIGLREVFDWGGYSERIEMLEDSAAQAQKRADDSRAAMERAKEEEARTRRAIEELSKLETRIHRLDASLDNEISSVEALMSRVLQMQNLAADTAQYMHGIENRASTLFLMDTAAQLSQNVGQIKSAMGEFKGVIEQSYPHLAIKYGDGSQNSLVVAFKRWFRFR